jgi:glycosyltransferase involved in cell wall biosynthesis
MIIPWRRGALPAHVVDDTLSALTAADWTSASSTSASPTSANSTAAEPPVAWLYWPVDAANPYQSLLYSRFAAHNLVPMALHRLPALGDLVAALPAGVPAVLHVHWLYEVTKASRNEAEALGLAAAFERQIGALRATGIRLVWTVHNILPHEAAYPAVQARLRKFMLGAADVVHVMHNSHVELLSDAFGVAPRQVVVVPHPSFVGAYPDWVDQRGARSALGIPLGARVLVTFGQIRPYKGHMEFLAALDRASALDPALRWLVAGKVRDEPGIQQFLRAAASHPAVLLFPGFAPDADVQLYLRAADAAAFPYQRSLNSGAVALSASFDLPAYASAQTHLADLMPAEAVRRLDLSDPQSAAKVLAEPLGGADVRVAVHAHTARLRPAVISDTLAAHIRSIMNLGS